MEVLLRKSKRQAFKFHNFGHGNLDMDWHTQSKGCDVKFQHSFMNKTITTSRTIKIVLSILDLGPKLTKIT